MKICGVIAEFNPMHNGHKHLIDQIRKTNGEDTAVVCVMSGNFVQRGEPALISKFARAKSAILNGCDLVIELPVPYSLSTAMYFAEGGVKALAGLGVVDNICFGSESANITRLQTISEVLNTSAHANALKENLKKGISFAAARQAAFEQVCPEIDSAPLNNPNDILAIEYISAVSKLGSNIIPQPIMRVGAGHNSYEVSGNICSSTAIREQLLNGKLPEMYMPISSLDILKEEITYGRVANIKNLDRAIVTHLRTTTATELQNTPDVSEGLENKIALAANSANTVDDILKVIKSKRYSMARLKRIILCSYLGITYGMQKRDVPYLRVLGMSEKGADVLSLAKGKATLPLIASLKEAERLGDYAQKLALLEVKAGDVYSMMLKNPVVGKKDYTTRLYKTF